MARETSIALKTIMSFSSDGRQKQRISDLEDETPLIQSEEYAESSSTSSRQLPQQRRRQRQPQSNMGKSPQLKSRTISFHASVKDKFPPNVVRNQKYSLITFFPLVFYEQFHVFINLYFLLVALSQFIPPLKIGTKD
ncbi:1403_t:CDS:2 [Acaulospora colombiana]|uniref:1403_t:CDS:1 n=1 Tax=Acaulospora colombiana TaxID=27376 RepID=A0ACA9K067_9GLOM|nr:1403_t:CDS:2 [Acaulospora colombiana]